MINSCLGSAMWLLLNLQRDAASDLDLALPTLTPFPSSAICHYFITLVVGMKKKYVLHWKNNMPLFMSSQWIFLSFPLRSQVNFHKSFLTHIYILYIYTKQILSSIGYKCIDPNLGNHTVHSFIHFLYLLDLLAVRRQRWPLGHCVAQNDTVAPVKHITYYT